MGFHINNVAAAIRTLAHLLAEFLFAIGTVEHGEINLSWRIFTENSIPFFHFKVKNEAVVFDKWNYLLKGGDFTGKTRNKSLLFFDFWNIIN